MKKWLDFVSIIVLCVVTVTLFSGMTTYTAQAAEPIQIPVTIRKVSNNDGLTLGSGVSLDRISPSYESPFKDQKTPPKRTISPSARLRMKLVTSSSALDAETGVNIEAKARFLFGSVEAKSEFNRGTSISEESFQLVIVGESEYGDDELQGHELKPEAAKLIQDEKMQEFAQRYGTHFVLREHRIARIVVTISIDRWSESTRENLRASLKGGASLPLIDGNLKVSIQDDLKRAGRRKTLNVEISTIGGAGLQGFGDLVKTLLTTAPDFQVAISEAIGVLLKGFTRDNSGIGAVTVVPYTTFGWKANNLNLWDDIFEDKLKKCAERYYQGRQVSRNIQLVMSNAKKDLKTKLETHATKYETYLEELSRIQKKLLEKNQETVKTDLPKEPEMDVETAKALLTRFATLENSLAQRKVIINQVHLEHGGQKEFGWASLLEGHGPREFKKRIKFPKDYAFEKVPSVAIALTGVETNTAIRVHVKVGEVYKDGFDVVIQTWLESKLYDVRFTYIAFASDFQP